MAHEPLRVDGVGLGEDSGPLLADGVGMPVVDVGGGVHPDAAVAVGVVVPGEEGDEERAGVLDAGEAVGEVGPVLQGLEVGLAVRVVVGDVWAGVGLGDTEVGQEERHRFGGHRGAVVGVDGQLVGVDVLLGDGVGQEPLGQYGGLVGGEHPPDDVAGVDVDDAVQVEVGPLRGPVELRDVPGPHLVGGFSDQLRFHAGRMRRLGAAFADLATGAQQPVHRRDRAQVHALIQQDRVDLRGRQVDEALLVEHTEHLGLLLG